MKRMFISVVLVTIVFSFLANNTFALFKSTKVTVVVLDENEKPLPEVKVGVGFEKNTGWGTNSTGQQGITDAEGKLIFSGKSNGHITYGGSNEGYYPSYYDYDFKDLGTFGWEPWNPELKILMRKIENPVTMYARNTNISRGKVEIPVIGEDIGFDLIAYDWVIPYGTGNHSDFIFNLNSRFSNNNNYEFIVILKFEEGNGIQIFKEKMNQGSLFKLPRYAPENGYENRLELFTKRSEKGIERSKKENVNYVFRVRSKAENGKVIEAIYGKILKDIYIRPKTNGRAEVDFTYYLNPDGTRNLEYDPNQNLFTDLTDLERVGIK